MSFINSTNMGFPVPTVGGPNAEPGPQYATDVNQALQTIDSHNHSPGFGVPVPSQGINIQSDLSFNVNNAIALRTSRYVPTTASSGTDVGCVYVKGPDLFYNDINGNVIRITINGGLASTALFTGLFNTSAIVSANSGNPATSGFIRMNNATDKIDWRNAANNGDDQIFFDNTDTFQVIGAGGLQATPLKINDPIGGKNVSLYAAPNTSGYNYIFPTMAPQFGPYTGSYASGGVVPGLTTTFLTNGRPVMLMLLPTSAAGTNATLGASVSVANTTPSFTYSFLRNTSALGTVFCEGGPSNSTQITSQLYIPLPSQIDNSYSATSTYTYGFQLSNGIANNLQLVAYSI